MKCDRCKNQMKVHTISWFNLDRICSDCKTEERTHPLYKKAKKVELAEVKKGNLNYKGMFATKTWEEIKQKTT